jgi:hypothetical protein
MTWGYVAVGGATLAGALIGANASGKASDAQVGSADRAAQLQKEQFDRTVELQEPFRQGGITSQNRLMQLLGLGGDTGAEGYGKYARDFGMQDFQQDPGYGFRMSEGMKALDRTAAARGGLISGGAMKAAQRFGQEMGSQEYGNAFNRYQTNRSNQLNPLQSLMGAGQTSANTLGAAGQNYANQAGEAYMGAGNARASGYMGQANAISGGLGQFLNYQQGQNMLNRFGNQPPQGPQWGAPQEVPPYQG